jgi:hypothetical protein
MEDTSRQQARGRLEGLMGSDPLPEPAWEILVARGHVDDYLRGGISEAELLGYARALAFYGDLVEHARAHSREDDGVHETESPQLSGYEAQRAETLASYLELQVAAHPHVLEWRRSCWGSTRPATSGYELVENLEIRDLASGYRTTGSNDAEPSGYLDYFARRSSGRVSRIAFYKGSSLERLRDLSEDLRTELFPLWSQAEAAWVIVTGKVWETPRSVVGKVEGFANDHLTFARVDIRVEPWIPAETVTQIYQHLQQVVMGRRPRSLSERNLAMPRFVMRQLRDMITDGRDTDEGPPMVSWRKLMGRWNETYPHWAYENDRQFYRDCRRIFRAVARPYEETDSMGQDLDTLISMSIPEHETA